MNGVRDEDDDDYAETKNAAIFATYIGENFMLKEYIDGLLLVESSRTTVSCQMLLDCHH